VDRNPLSVELCKTALWIEAIEPGRPLTFLDAHVKCGDSLIGVADLSVLKAGIPDEAFKELTGDDKVYCRDLRRQNKGERENPVLSLLPEVALPLDLASAMAALTEAPEDTAEAVREKSRALASLQSGRAAHDLRVACDMWCAAFFAPKSELPERRGLDLVPTTDTVWRYLRAPSSIYGPLVGAVEELRARLRFFHWPLEFPDAFAAGGFDCLLGNPPWERIKLQEKEFFDSRRQEIAQASNAAARRKLIAALRVGDPIDRALHRAFEYAKRDADAAGQFARGSARFPLTAVGDVNVYALFAEAFVELRRPVGFAGVVLPSGIATDDTTKAFFDFVATGNLLRSLLGMDEVRAWFPSTDDRRSFCLLTFGAGSEPARFLLNAETTEHLLDERRAFRLSADDIRALNPNTRTCPVFRSARDAELTKSIYARVPVLIDEAKGRAGNPWGISFLRMLDMSNDSGLFRTAAQLAEVEAQRDGANWLMPNGVPMLPLYEAKMIHHFDHRWAGAGDPVEQRGHDTDGHAAFDTVTPRYWIAQNEVLNRLEGMGWGRKWLVGFRGIARATDERSFIGTALPIFGVGNSLPLLMPDGRFEADQIACLQANMSSLTLDFIVRQKISGANLNFFIVKQFPLLPPASFTKTVRQFLVPRILELTYTAEDMRPWAEDLGYTGPPFAWDETRRAHLRAELDAAYAHLYGLTRDELRYILDPTDIYGADFPSETFRVLKEREVRLYGEYRTRRLVLAAWDRLTADGTFAGWAE